MWRQGYEAYDSEASSSFSHGVSQIVVPSKMMPETWNERYSHSMLKMKEICAVMSECGASVYAERYEILNNLLTLWAQDKKAAVFEVVKNNGGKRRPNCRLWFYLSS